MSDHQMEIELIRLLRRSTPESQDAMLAALALSAQEWAPLTQEEAERHRATLSSFMEKCQKFPPELVALLKEKEGSA